MTTLIFEDRGYEVVTSGWSVAAKPGKNSIRICYVWGDDGVGWFDSSTGIASCELEMSMSEFILRIKAGSSGIVDLRLSLQKA